MKEPRPPIHRDAKKEYVPGNWASGDDDSRKLSRPEGIKRAEAVNHITNKDCADVVSLDVSLPYTNVNEGFI